MKNISTLGATGSIGTQTLDVIRKSNDINLIGITANTSVDMVKEIIDEFYPKYVGMMDKSSKEKIDNYVKEKGLDIEVPKNYFPSDNPSLEPMVTWRGSANVVFSNWLNYCVYQNTPYNLEEL